MIRVIFLDFDGVANNTKTLGALQDAKQTLWVMDPDNVACLNDLVRRAGPEETAIVISSSWRHAHSVAVIREILAEHGFEFPGLVVDMTPRRLGAIMETGLYAARNARPGHTIDERIFEIAEWVGGNQARIQSFVILDDDQVYNWDAKLPPTSIEAIARRHALTSTATGLTPADVEKALEHLRTPWSRT